MAEPTTCFPMPSIVIECLTSAGHVNWNDVVFPRFSAPLLSREESNAESLQRLIPEQQTDKKTSYCLANVTYIVAL